MYMQIICIFMNTFAVDQIYLNYLIQIAYIDIHIDN